MSEFVCTPIMGVKFELTSRYSDPLPVELDAFGLICSAKDRILNKLVAVKKITRPFGSSMLAKSALREVKLLRYMRHENIIGLADVFISPQEDLYIVTDLMWTNLQVLIAKGPLHSDFAKCFLYQILRGLKYVHSAGIIHRDLKPHSILIDENCDLRICDFGHARLQDFKMTGYVATRYYRAPEIMLNWQEYSEKVDIWGAACILAEMLRGTPLFPANSHADQFALFVNLLGNPSEHIVDNIKNNNTRAFVQSLPKCERRPLAETFPEMDREALDILERMLSFDVDERISAEVALSHPYVATYHDPTDEPVVDSPFDWRFDNAEVNIEAWKTAVIKEVLFFRQQALHRRQQITLRNAIIDATQGHVPPTIIDTTKEHIPPPAPVAVFPVMGIEEFTPPEEDDFCDDISAFIHDFN
ncbi:mitogen-activated protein kinase Hog1 [Penicillium frequentans]|nr:mitogen-activated protein kinase Hog1 [Penicillium glabrum]